MDSLLFAVIVTICISKDAAKSSDCTPGKDMACSTNTLRVDNAQVCYTRSKDGWKAKLTCDKGRLTGPGTYTCQSSVPSWTPPFASSCVSTGMTVTITSELTTSKMINKTSTEDITALSSRKPLAFSDDIGSVVIPAVLVSVVVVITLAVIVFLLWRRCKRLRSHNVTGGNSGISTTNMHYEDLRPDQFAESGYTEYLHSNLTAEETAGSVYQTIDSLPEDQTECKRYEHLQMHTTQPIDGYYMDIAANHINVKTSFDATYTKTPYDANAQELRNDEENEI